MPRTTDLPKNEILNRYDQGETIQTLANDYARSYATMRENLIRWGANIRRSGPVRVVNFNERYFETIDTEAKAYWLGFILADGSVVQTGAGNWIMRLDLARKDRGHVEKLAQVLGDVKVKDHRGSSYLSACSVNLCQDLVRHGCIPRKTFGHPAPELRPKLMRHMYRGYWDGDGWVTATNGQMVYGLVGCPGFVEAHRQWLDAQLGLGLGWVKTGPVAFSVRYTGNDKVGKILDLLYDKATVWLDRKRQRYLELKK